MLTMTMQMVVLKLEKLVFSSTTFSVFFFIIYIFIQLAEILPTEENFLLLFRKDNPLESSVDFMKVWKQFDTDCSGYIEADELKQFIKALLNRRQGNKVTEEKLIEYTDTMVCRTFVRLLYFFKIFISLQLHIFDANGDGKLQFSEMTK